MGPWASVRRILGRKWVDDGHFSVRLITDFFNSSNLNYETLKQFYDRGHIKGIKGLHAKIYIIDNDALVSSANLTNTAFARRYEVGVWLSGKEAGGIISLFEEWWERVANEISPGLLPKLAHRRVRTEKEEMYGDALEALWKLPSDPGPGKASSRFLDYDTFRARYKDFATVYAKIQRVWPNRPLYFETDGFLNYCFHHAPGRPSKKYAKIKARVLSDGEREKEIEKYARRFKDWVSHGADGVETDDWRTEYSEKIKRLLSREKILRIYRTEIRQIVDCLHCMNSFPLNKSRFLNPKNNDLQTIRRAWQHLVDEREPLVVRMAQCAQKLRYFGRSSIHEMLGNLDPEEYPLRNTNSGSGLKFFGYHVSAY
ncbi:MAG: hypothetical protein HYZ73_06395 [Elusimicrobia bacterium]|nr:hypothetical protein [Elusimicrobiota bacterium]